MTDYTHGFSVIIIKLPQRFAVDVVAGRATIEFIGGCDEGPRRVSSIASCWVGPARGPHSVPRWCFYASSVASLRGAGGRGLNGWERYALWHLCGHTCLRYVFSGYLGNGLR